MRVNSKINHILIWLLAAMSVLNVLLPVAALADDERKTVRVGYVNALNYEEGGEGEYKSGAGYEYLQRISYITGWKYEYVYGSFAECMNMLENGEIDLFGNVSYTEERAEKVSYSAYPQGKDTYWLYTSKNHQELTGGYIDKLAGIKIGVTAGSFQEGLLRSWLLSNDIHADIVEYPGYDAMMEALSSDEVGAIAAPDLSAGYECLAIASIGFSDYYFAVSKQRPDILSELNSALYEIQTSETDYNTRLFSRYYYKTASGLSFGAEERQWLDEHNNTIRFGYFADNLPFCADENGQLTGIIATVMEALEREYGLTVEAVPYAALSDMKAALRAGKIDVAGPVISDFYLTEQDELILTDSIVDTTPVIIYSGSDYQGSLKVIAASDSCMFGPDIVGVLFPEAEIYPCANQDECLKAVSDGKAGCTIIPSSRINILSADPLMKSLNFAEIARGMDVGLLASRDSRRAASIVNKGIEQSSELLNGVVMAQHSAGGDSFSLSEYIKTHAWLIVGSALVIILVLAMLIRWLYVSRKQLVAALADAKNANTANVAKTTFLNNMSHDIRTPMNAIIGFTSIASKLDPTPDIKNCLDKIKQSSEYLLSLINDVLDISRIESGKVKYNPKLVDITTVTDSVLEITRGFLIDRDLQVEVKRAEIDDPYVMADDVHIREILMNIISNAIKFTDDGGKISLETAYRPGADERHILVVYKISDTGIGMEESFKDQIFDEFSQENTGARTQYKGTGLGMTITKRFVELMHGTITVESRKNVGSTFTVELPLERAERPEPKKGESDTQNISLEGVRVLMAEDNDLNAEIAETLLEERGMKVTRAADGQQAVDMFASAQPGTYDLILMDIMMPEKNGYEATREIRSLPDRPDGRSIPIIAMTANAFAEDVQAALDAGMNAHLSKPIVMENVVRVISQNLAAVRKNDGTESR